VIGNNGFGSQSIAISSGGIDIESVAGGGFAFITQAGTGNQTITVADGTGVQVRSVSGSGSGQINNFGPGNQLINVSGGGGVEVATLAGTGFAVISNAGTGSQTISVTGGSGIDLASAGGFANISNNAPGSQTITVTGGVGIDVLSNGGSAGIQQAAAGSAQMVSVTDADHIAINGLTGFANIFANGGAQSVSITGSGANAIVLGSPGALGFSQIAGSTNQSVTAGVGAQQGSITIVGPAANSTTASIVSSAAPGGAQNIETSGLLAITGGTAPNQTFGSGIFHNGSGVQTITAADVSVTGGPGGSGNRAQIGSFGGGVPANAGNQVLNVAGGQISVRGSDAGSVNNANIITLADQFINGNPDLVLIGGASNVPGVSTNNFAAIQTAVGRSQTIHAGTITIGNSPTANADSFAAINSSHQTIITTGDVIITAAGGVARIGAPGPGGGVTDVQLTVGGNLLMDGGVSVHGAAIGSSGLGTAFANQVSIAATGDVILNSGTGGARIGSAAATGTAGGNISVSGRSIQLNGAGAAIRTLDNVVLHADQPGGTISESGNGFILANSLTTTSGGNTSLAGPNQIANFAASSGGDVTLHNNVALNVGNLTAVGDATVSNVGAVTLTGAWNSNAATIAADSIATGLGGSVQASSLVTDSTGATSLTGPNQVVVYNGTSGSDLAFNNAAPLNVTAVNAGGTAALTAAGTIGISGPVVASGVVLTANGGGIDEFGGGSIVAGSLTTVSTGDTTLNGANQLSFFNATSAGGDVSLNNTGVLDVTGMNAFGDATIANIGNVTVSGPWTAGGTSTITVGSDILLQSTMQSHDVVLVSTTGAIIQDADASIVAETLTASSLGDTHLDGTNAVGTISVTSTQGDVSFKTSSPFLTLSSIDLPGALVIDHTGAVNVSGHVSALSHDISATGNVIVGGADAQTATLLYAPGNISITTPESILVHGSDTNAGAASAVIAGGALRFDAGEVSIRGGGAFATPAIVRGGVVDMSVQRLNVTGGSGHLSPAWLLSGSDINLTLGEAVRLQAGSGLLSWAKIQTETRDGVIRMTFPTLSEGGFFVNGDEGDVKHDQTGFYTLHKPVKIGDTLILEYGAP
jgi:hypothetical protein